MSNNSYRVGGGHFSPSPRPVSSASSVSQEGKATSEQADESVVIHVGASITPNVQLAVDSLIGRGVAVTLRPGPTSGHHVSDIALQDFQSDAQEPGQHLEGVPQAPVPPLAGDRPGPWAQRLSTAAMVGQVGVRNALVQGAGQAIAGAVHMAFFSMLYGKMADEGIRVGAPAMAGGLGLAGGLVVAVGGARGELDIGQAQRGLERAVRVLLQHGAPLVAQLLPSPYAQIGLVLAVSQMGRTLGTPVGEGFTHLLRGTGPRVQLVLPEDALEAQGMQARTLSATVDRDRRAIMAAVYVLAGVIGAMVFAQRATAFDALVDDRLRVDALDPRYSWGLTSQNTLLDMALPAEAVLTAMSAFFAFAETVAGAIAARRHGLGLVARNEGWSEPFLRNLSVDPDVSPKSSYATKLAQRLNAEWKNVDWLAALMRTGLEMAGVSSSAVAQGVSRVVTNVAQYFTRAHGVRAQGQDMREAQLEELRSPQAEAGGVVRDADIVVPRQERSIGDLMGRYDLFLGSTGTGLEFQKQEVVPEGQ